MYKNKIKNDTIKIKKMIQYLKRSWMIFLISNKNDVDDYPNIYQTCTVEWTVIVTFLSILCLISSYPHYKGINDHILWNK